MNRVIDNVRFNEAKEMLQGWRNAERAVMTGQEYRIGSSSLRRVDLKDIAARIKYWENEVARLESGATSGIRVQRVVPRDI